MDTFTQLSNYLSLDLGFDISLQDQATLNINMFAAKHTVHLCEHYVNNEVPPYHFSYSLEDSPEYMPVDPGYVVLNLILENLLIVHGLKVSISDDTTMDMINQAAMQYKAGTGCDLIINPIVISTENREGTVLVLESSTPKIH
ncbi:hypothetical protein [Yersinia ruckeri]|uniref:hypothetical protein n=1 Tax=Yersinia ruckeri TaxID=29486 RepID=UPI0022370C7E|nr:hypothetical protein [Yersinia ruckeri]MCW6598870.1 hypothetical protein [Yersinia ruckeri]